MTRNEYPEKVDGRVVSALDDRGEVESSHYLLAALNFLVRRLDARLAAHFGKTAGPAVPLGPPVDSDKSPLANFVRRHELNSDEITVLMLALVPHVLPGCIDEVVQRYLPEGGDIVELGGRKGQNHRGTLPTAETALFVLAGIDPSERLSYLPLLGDEHLYFGQNILSLGRVDSNEPPLSGCLLMDREFVEVFTTGRVGLPKLSMSFPAEHLVTEMEWDDLVLSEGTMRQIHEIENWVNHHVELMESWGMKRRIRPGYRALFYGPPGTGKTLTASLLGKYTGREVFRIDLSMVVSKYIGETEKNLSTLFDRAEHKNWILFFDEADALFGKRTGIRDAHDKYANQEVSYLMQRIELHSSLVILASNFKNNIDKAFIRRFDAMVYFHPPECAERLALWRTAFPSGAPLGDDASFEELARRFELTGAQIVNIVRHTCLEFIASKREKIQLGDIERGVHRELAKEGR